MSITLTQYLQGTSPPSNDFVNWASLYNNITHPQHGHSPHIDRWCNHTLRQLQQSMPSVTPDILNRILPATLKYTPVDKAMLVLEQAVQHGGAAWSDIYDEMVPASLLEKCVWTRGLPWVDANDVQTQSYIEKSFSEVHSTQNNPQVKTALLAAIQTLNLVQREKVMNHVIGPKIWDNLFDHDLEEWRQDDGLHMVQWCCDAWSITSKELILYLLSSVKAKGLQESRLDPLRRIPDIKNNFPDFVHVLETLETPPFITRGIQRHFHTEMSTQGLLLDIEWLVCLRQRNTLLQSFELYNKTFQASIEQGNYEIDFTSTSAV